MELRLCDSDKSLVVHCIITEIPYWVKVSCKTTCFEHFYLPIGIDISMLQIQWCEDKNAFYNNTGVISGYGGRISYTFFHEQIAHSYATYLNLQIHQLNRSVRILDVLHTFFLFEFLTISGKKIIDIAILLFLILEDR